jgi:DNA repair exonuclease SbcCD ATPase subunit
MLHDGHDEQELRRRARAALASGLIPRDHPKGLWGGNGSGETCPVCGIPVDPAEMELEVEFEFAEVGAQGVREFHLHLPCFAAWEVERRRG